MHTSCIPGGRQVAFRGWPHPFDKGTASIAVRPWHRSIGNCMGFGQLKSVADRFWGTRKGKNSLAHRMIEPCFFAFCMLMKLVNTLKRNSASRKCMKSLASLAGPPFSQVTTPASAGWGILKQGPGLFGQGGRYHELP